MEPMILDRILHLFLTNQLKMTKYELPEMPDHDIPIAITDCDINPSYNKIYQ